MILVMMLLVLSCGGILAITPHLMPPTECFAVTVPPSAQNDPRIGAYRRAFTVVILALSCLGAASLGLFAKLHGVGPKDEATLAAVITFATFVPIVTGFGLMLYYRSRVIGLKEREGWAAASNRAVAVVADDDLPRPISLAWNLLYLVIVAGLAAFVLANYDRFPERIPMQVSFDGTVTRWAEKSRTSVLFPVALAAFMGLVLTFAHAAILHAKRPIDPAAPATSALAYGTFARTQSLVLLVGGIALSASMGASVCFAWIGSLSMLTAGALVCAMALALSGAEIWVAIAQGQSGARLARELCATDELAHDDDAHWPLGVLYFNRDDPSVIVPKRFGVGWTANMARPLTWACLALLVLVTLAFAWASETLVR